MRHAGPAALDELEPLLEQLRAVPGLRERSRGTFYLRSRAFLHFHEDAAGLFADLRLGPEFVRLPVSSPQQRADLLDRVLAGGYSGAWPRCASGQGCGWPASSCPCSTGPGSIHAGSRPTT